MIEKILQDLVILTENVYNMNETKVMLFMPGFVKVLVGKNDIRDYRDARIKRTTMTAIECISADDKYLTSMII
jgi:3'-phosphoadenosine 5'-phosphosulfate sulfotransferase